MKPRLPTSGKGTEFPLDYIKLIKEVITGNFKKACKGRELIIDGMIYPEEVLLRVGFLGKGSIKPINFEASAEHSLKLKNIQDKMNLALDAIGSMIDQYFKADGDIEFPHVWTEFKMEGQAVFLQISSENPSLEKAADEILKGTGDGVGDGEDSD